MKKITILLLLLSFSLVSFAQIHRVNEVRVKSKIKLKKMTIDSFSIDGTFSASTDTKISSSLAIKTYIDNQISGVSGDTLFQITSGHNLSGIASPFQNDIAINATADTVWIYDGDWSVSFSGGGGGLWVTDANGINSDGENIGIGVSSTASWALNVFGDFDFLPLTDLAGSIRNPSGDKVYEFKTVSDNGMFDINGALEADKIRLYANGESYFNGGQMKFGLYGSGTYTGTPAYFPAFNATGQIIERTGAELLADIGGGVTGLTEDEVLFGDSGGNIDQISQFQFTTQGLYLKAQSATATNNLLTLVASDDAQMFSVKYTGEWNFGGPKLFGRSSGDADTPQPNNNNRGLSIRPATTVSYATGLFNISQDAGNNFGGTSNLLNLEGAWSPTSSSHAYAWLEVEPIVNQVGSTGITRGVYIDPTLTAVADYRGLEITNNSHFGIYQSGANAENYFNGAVGIGTYAPSSKLEVIGATTATASLENTTTSNYLMFYNSATGTNDLNDGILLGNSSLNAFVHNKEAGYLSLGTNGNGAITIDDNFDVSFLNAAHSDKFFYWDASEEFVGIGTETPNYQLHIQENGTGTNYLQFTNDDTGETTGDGFHIGLNSDEEGVINVKENEGLFLATNNTTRITIEDGGDVGIGINNPAQLLHVNGNMRLEGLFFDENNQSGPTDYVLTATATGVDWQENAAKVASAVVTVTTTSHTTDEDEYAMLVDDDTAGSTVTINLPAASTVTDKVYNVKKLGTTANVIIDPNGTETIDGATTATISTQYVNLQFITDGSNWFIL